MSKETFLGCCVSVALVALGITACSKAPGSGSPGRIDAASMPAERFSQVGKAAEFRGGSIAKSLKGEG